MTSTPKTIKVGGVYLDEGGRKLKAVARMGEYVFMTDWPAFNPPNTAYVWHENGQSVSLGKNSGYNINPEERI